VTLLLVSCDLWVCRILMQFVYKAKQGPLKTVEGVIDAENDDSAIAKILERGLSPVYIKRKPQRDIRRSQRPVLGGGLFIGQRVPAGEVIMFTRQVSDLLGAGVSLLQTLLIVQRQIRHATFKEDVQQMISVVRDGGSFSRALGQFPDVFPLLYVNMIRSGEVAGNLDLVMNRLADFSERDQEVRNQIVTALMYPALIVVVGGITVFVLLTWVIPKITLIFADLNQTLPLPTIILMGLSGFFVKFWWLILLLMTAGILYIQRMNSLPQGKLFFDHLKLNVPLAGSFLKDIQLGRFARTLGTLLESGVEILAALESVGRLMDNQVLKQQVQQVAAAVQDGKSLAAALASNDYFPETVVSMVAVGAESGRTEKGLYKLADYYERRSQRFMKRMLSLMEPMLILLMGLIVGFVVLAMLMPIFRMNLIIQ